MQSFEGVKMVTCSCPVHKLAESKIESEGPQEGIGVVVSGDPWVAKGGD